MDMSKIKSALWVGSMVLLSQSAWALDSKNLDLAAKQIQVALSRLQQGQSEGAKEHLTAAKSHLEVARREASDTVVYDRAQQKLTDGLTLLKNNRSQEASASMQKALDGIWAIR